MCKKYKHHLILSQYPNCPPSDYKEIETFAFRWVHNPPVKSDFLPLKLITDPPRVLDTDDLNCQSCGLSLFHTLSYSITIYENQLKMRRGGQRQKFIIDKGSCIAKLKIEKSDGVGSPPIGHFTFHEYFGVELESKSLDLFDIFDKENGDIRSYSD